MDVAALCAHYDFNQTGIIEELALEKLWLRAN